MCATSCQLGSSIGPCKAACSGTDGGVRCTHMYMLCPKGFLRGRHIGGRCDLCKSCGYCIVQTGAQTQV